MAMLANTGHTNGPKKTRQGKSVNTILAPTSRNKRKKKYRGQGR